MALLRSRYVASGFKSDMENLICSFVDTNSLRFSDFSQCWQKHKFSYIFWGRQQDNELHEFLDECYFLITSEFSDSKETSRRVASFYLMYSVYLKQPLSQKIPVRLTYTIWLQIQDLISFAKREGHLDIFYIWKKLIDLGGVNFVYTQRPYGPAYIRNISTVPTFSKSIVEQKISFKNELESQLMEISNIHCQYSEMKYSQDEEAIKTLNLDDCFVELRNKLTKLCDTSETSSLKHEDEEDIGAKRRRLKNRSCKKLL